MILESLNNLNIKRMVLETPEKSEELPFDVERDITQEDWVWMKHALENLRNVNSWYGFADQAMAMRTLELTASIDLTKRDWDCMSQELAKYRTEENKLFPKKIKATGLRHFLDLASAMKVLNHGGMSLNLDQQTWHTIKKQLGEYEVLGWWDEFTSQAITMKILDPSIDFDSDKRICDGIKQELERHRDGGWDSFAEQAAKIKILGLNIDLNLDEKAWSGMKQRLGEFRNGDGYLFAQQSKAMKILAAEEVRVTDKGIELIMPKPKVKPIKDIPPMPETKKF